MHCRIGASRCNPTFRAEALLPLLVNRQQQLDGHCGALVAPRKHLGKAAQRQPLANHKVTGVDLERHQRVLACHGQPLLLQPLPGLVLQEAALHLGGCRARGLPRGGRRRRRAGTHGCRELLCLLRLLVLRCLHHRSIMHGLLPMENNPRRRCCPIHCAGLRLQAGAAGLCCTWQPCTGLPCCAGCCCHAGTAAAAADINDSQGRCRSLCWCSVEHAAAAAGAGAGAGAASRRVGHLNTAGQPGGGICLALRWASATSRLAAASPQAVAAAVWELLHPQAAACAPTLQLVPSFGRCRCCHAWTRGRGWAG